jgi:parallel beta-helix repeat protein
LQSNEIDHNNLLGFDALWQAGGAKFTDATNLTVVGNEVHENFGPGLWFDSDSTGISVVENTVAGSSEVYGNGNGIMYEISCNAKIASNRVTGNDDAGIFLSNSHDVTVGGPGAGNTVSDNGEYGVRVLADARTEVQSNCGSELTVDNIVVKQNAISMLAGDSVNGVQRVAPAIAVAIFFSGNDYRMPPGGCSDTRWKWWDGTTMNTVPFSGGGTTWQGTFLQDLAPGGRCDD